MPGTFTGSTFLIKVQMWLPAIMSARLTPSVRMDRLRFMLLRRLKPSVSIATATSDVNRVRELIARDHPDRQPDRSTLTLFVPRGVFLTNERRGQDSNDAADRGRRTRPSHRMSQRGDLLLARTSSRRKEIAVRLAVGANGIRLVRQLITKRSLNKSEHLRIGPPGFLHPEHMNPG
jgi:hypothetical protein